MTNNNDLARDEDGWFVSSFSHDAACVQVKFAGPGNILVRDSKDRRSDGQIIAMPSQSWTSLLRDITS